MKEISGIIILMILFSAFGLASAQDATQEDLTLLKNEFDVQTKEWIKAYNSKDATNLIPLYAEDAVYISGHVSGLELNGRHHVIANFQNGMNGGGHIDSIEIVSIISSGDVATLLCKYQATNSGVTVTGRNLLVMKKIKEKWMIAIHMTVV